MRSRRRWTAAMLAGALLLSACTGSDDKGDKGDKDTEDAQRSVGSGAGSAGVGDHLFPRLGNGGYHVEHYALALDWQPVGNRLAGTATISARSTQRLTSFKLDFHALDVRATTVDGKAARVGRKGDKMTVTPAAPLAEGQPFTVKVTYDGTPQTITDPDGSREGWLPVGADGAIAVGEPAGSPGWFPGNHTPADKATYEIALTVPQGLTAVSNGRLTERTAADGRQTFCWQSAAPMASYLAMVAIGRFRVEEPVVAGVPSYIAVDPAQDSDETRAIPGVLSDMLTWAGARFGAYPFGEAGAIVANAPDLGYALETQTRPFFETAPAAETVIHELAHQWFGDSVGPRTWRDMWLNEGFATYVEWLWSEDHGGPPASAIFDEQYDRSGPADQGIWAFPPADPGTAANVSAPPVYARGAMVLHKIREAVGDAVFAEILRTWVAEHRHGTATTADFVALCERLAGRSLAAVFGPWLFDDGKPPKS